MFDLDFDFDFDFGGGHFSDGHPDGFGSCLLIVGGGLILTLVIAVAAQNLPVILTIGFLFLTVLFAPKSRKSKVSDWQKLLLLISFFALIVTSCWTALEFQEYQHQAQLAAEKAAAEEQRIEAENAKIGFYGRAKKWFWGEATVVPTETPVMESPPKELPPEVVQASREFWGLPPNGLPPSTEAPTLPKVESEPAPIVTSIADVNSENQNVEEEKPSVMQRLRRFFGR